MDRRSAGAEGFSQRTNQVLHLGAGRGRRGRTLRVGQRDQFRCPNTGQSFQAGAATGAAMKAIAFPAFVGATVLALCTAVEAADKPTSLKEAFKGHFLVG